MRPLLFAVLLLLVEARIQTLPPRRDFHPSASLWPKLSQRTRTGPHIGSHSTKRLRRRSPSRAVFWTGGRSLSSCSVWPKLFGVGRAGFRDAQRVTRANSRPNRRVQAISAAMLRAFEPAGSANGLADVTSRHWIAHARDQRAAQFLQRVALDLADALFGNAEPLAQSLQRHRIFFKLSLLNDQPLAI